MRRELEATKTQMYLLRNSQAAGVGGTVTATPLPATVTEGLTYVFMGEKYININKLRQSNQYVLHTMSDVAVNLLLGSYFLSVRRNT